jgi:hypothetical protein
MLFIELHATQDEQSPADHVMLNFKRAATATALTQHLHRVQGSQHSALRLNTVLLLNTPLLKVASLVHNTESSCFVP